MIASRLAFVATLAVLSVGVVQPAPAQGLLGALGSSTLRRGAHGDSVRALQQRLNAHRVAAGLPPIGVDGAFGPQTEAAVREFQGRAGLVVDGLVGPQTRGALARDPGAGGTPPPVTTPAPAPPPPGSGRRLELPARPAGAITGSQFVGRVAGMSLQQRESELLREVQRGNVPAFLRTLRPVQLQGNDRDGRPRRVTLWVAPDYVSVGSDQDFVRFPMTPMSGQRIADRTGCLLPTTKIVDAIYRQAEGKLAPSPMTADSTMTLPSTFLRHHQRIEGQRTSQGIRLGQLIAGIKKDVVNTPRLVSRPTQVAIYGWHRTNGQPIQPLSLVHGRTYVDYSHGIRLVSAFAEVDGAPRSLNDLLRDPVLAPLVSSEGPLRDVRVP